MDAKQTAILDGLVRDRLFDSWQSVTLCRGCGRPDCHLDCLDAWEAMGATVEPRPSAGTGEVGQGLPPVSRAGSVGPESSLDGDAGYQRLADRLHRHRLYGD